MRTAIFAILLLGLAGLPACEIDSSSGNCPDWYRNESGYDAEAIQFCLTGGAKAEGQCCVEDSQCESGRCCPWGQTCGGRESCECAP